MKSLLRLFAGLAVASTMNARLTAAELPIIARARAYLGTDAALDRVTSIRYMSTMTTTDRADPTKEVTAAVELIFVKPDRQKITARFRDNFETTALDSYEAWMQVQDTLNPSRWRLTLLDAQQVKRLRANTWHNIGFLRGIEEAGGRIEDLGTVTVEGVTCRKVAFIHGPKTVFHRYFDVATGRAVMIETDSGATVRESGEIIVNGVRFPQSVVTTVRTGDRTQTVTLQHEKIVLNEEFPPETFRVPQVPRR